MRPAIVLIMLASTLTLPMAAADETQPDCEETQPWVFYGRSDPVRALYASQGSPGALALCEGEHWDGQDSVSSTPASCWGAIDTDPTALHASLCMGADPNAAPGDDALNPVGVRLSSDGGRAYAAANVAFLARGAVYADDDTLAVYARDNTPGNILATLTRGPSVVPHPPSEMDCDQFTYQWDQYDGGGQICGRDNTAITLEHGLLP